MKAVPELPDEVINITDDDVARRFLTQCDLLGALEDCPATDGTASAMGLHHSTHWILAVHFMGNPLPADNGFLVIGWPKSRFKKEVMHEKLRQINLDPGVALWSKSHRVGDATGLQ